MFVLGGMFTYVQSEGNGACTVKVGLTIRVGHRTRLVSLVVLEYIWTSSVAVSVSGLVVTTVWTSVAVVGVVSVKVMFSKW